MPDLPFPSLTLADLAALEPARTVVLTVNNRLARRLTMEMSADVSAPQAMAAVLPWRTWFEALAERRLFRDPTALAGNRLDDFGARLLWRRAIEAETTNLLDTFEAARLAADARHLMHEWEVAVAPDTLHEEYAQFQAWQAGFTARLEACDADDAEQRLQRLLACLEGDGGGLRLPENIVLAGMRELSPRQRRLLAALAGHGCGIHTLDHAASPARKIARVAAADRGAEWRAAAAWARRKLESGPGRYAIVAMSLQQDAAFARRVLQSDLSGHGFNMSVGRPLTEWPLVRAALGWLKLLTTSAPYPVDFAGGALLAGHCAGHWQEAGVRARLDADWRWREYDRLSEDAWWRALQQCPQLHDSWNQAQATLGAGRDAASLRDWARILHDALNALGFPGDVTLDSASYQTLQAFHELWRKLAALAPAAGEAKARQAVSLLEQLANDTPFQPQRDPGARLDVLGALEAEGGRWDAIWVLGMTDDVLPAPPAPNPFLPTAALAEANAPRATATRELAYAQALYAALQCCADDVLVSHALLDGERELRASPLIAALEAGMPPVSPQAAATAPIRLEGVIADPGPPLTADQTMAGGAALLEAQSRNPLWAFARYRLGARLLPAYAGQTPMAAMRGNFLHLAMQTLWEELASSRGLAQAMAAATLDEQLERALDIAATAELARLTPALRELECQRAREVLGLWLQREAMRHPFEIAHLEGTQIWQHGPLSLTLRLDRVDRLQDGSLAIIDYKSGTLLDIKGWARPRPVTLQLPFYATALARTGSDREVAALALVRLHAREVSAKGLAGVDLNLQGVPRVDEEPGGATRWLRDFAEHDWPGWVAAWSAAFASLADEFIAGHAANLVADPNDLKYCDVMPFLRLDLEFDTDEAAP